MSWGSYRAGTAEEVIKSHETDLSHCDHKELVSAMQDVVRAFTLGLPDNVIVLVENSGHVDSSYGGNMSFVIKTYKKS